MNVENNGVGRAQAANHMGAGRTESQKEQEGRFSHRVVKSMEEERNRSIYDQLGGVFNALYPTEIPGEERLSHLDSIYNSAFYAHLVSGVLLVKGVFDICAALPAYYNDESNDESNSVSRVELAGLAGGMLLTTTTFLLVNRVCQKVLALRQVEYQRILEED